jgi:hypothetical protein
MEEDVSTNNESMTLKEKAPLIDIDFFLDNEPQSTLTALKPSPVSAKVEEEKPASPTLPEEEIKVLKDAKSCEEVLLDKYAGWGESDPLESFPYLYPMLPHPVASRISEIYKASERFDPSSSADHSLAWFLFNFSKKSNSGFYNNVLRCVLAYRECINNHGLQILSKYSQENRDFSIMSNIRGWLGSNQPQVKLTALIKAEYIFLCADFFLSHYLPTRYAQWFHREFALDFIVMLNKWMVDQSLSKVYLCLH